MFHTMDLNHDGKLSYEEFSLWYNDVGNAIANIPQQSDLINQYEQEGYNHKEQQEKQQLQNSRQYRRNNNRGGSLGTSRPVLSCN